MIPTFGSKNPQICSGGLFATASLIRCFRGWYTSASKPVLVWAAMTMASDQRFFGTAWSLSTEWIEFRKLRFILSAIPFSCECEHRNVGQICLSCAKKLKKHYWYILPQHQKEVRSAFYQVFALRHRNASKNSLKPRAWHQADRS